MFFHYEVCEVASGRMDMSKNSRLAEQLQNQLRIKN